MYMQMTTIMKKCQIQNAPHFFYTSYNSKCEEFYNNIVAVEIENDSYDAKVSMCEKTDLKIDVDDKKAI